MPKAKKQKQTRSQASPLRRRPNTRSQTQADAAIASRVPPTEAIQATEHSVAEPAPSTPNSTRAAASTAPDPPAVQETEPAWASRVWVGTTISMTRALALYRLKKEDLDDLPSTMSKHEVNGFPVPMRLYKERDVERRAWDKYGGPEGFLAQLDKLRKRHSNRKSKTEFKCPDAYAPGSGPVDDDPHVMRSHKLAAVKRDMLPWLWAACNASLDAFADIQDDGVGFRRYEREDAMQAALRVLVGRYPPRPHAPLPPSPAVDALRAVLAQAPQLPPRPEWGKQKVAGLEYSSGSWPDEEDSYEWDETYLGRVFRALSEIIKLHGRDDRGWATARWEVYETYKERMWCGICYVVQLNERSWEDGAAKWLRDDHLNVGLAKYCGVPAASGSSRLQRIG